MSSSGTPASIPPESPHTRGIGLIALLREDLAAHRGEWTRAGFRAIAVYRFGVWCWRIRVRPVRFVMKWIHRRMFLRVRNRYGIEIPPAAQIGRRVTFEHQHGIVIHGHCVIGNDCTIRQGVTLGNKNNERRHDAPTLGERVDVGAGAKVLGRVNIGDGARIGANAVVLIDVPAGRHRGRRARYTSPIEPIIDEIPHIKPN